MKGIRSEKNEGEEKEKKIEFVRVNEIRWGSERAKTKKQ